MKNQYVGDIGDYIKYALLRAIMNAESKKKLGVAWYLTPDGKKSDGKHIDYLQRPKQWRCLDECLFDELKQIVEEEDGKLRKVAEVERRKILGGKTVFHPDILGKSGTKASKANFRRRWFKELKKELEHCAIVFADPDDGFRDDDIYDYDDDDHWKCVPLEEAVELTKNKIGIFYHHTGRQKPLEDTSEIKARKFQIQKWREKLTEYDGIDRVIAVNARAWTNRTFFVTNPTDEIEIALDELVKRAPLTNTRLKSLEIIENMENLFK